MYLQEDAVSQDKDGGRAENTCARSNLLGPEFLVPHPNDYRREPIDEKRNCARSEDCGDAHQWGNRRLSLSKRVEIEYAGWQEQLPECLRSNAPERQGKGCQKALPALAR